MFYVVYNDPPMTMGPGTFIAQILDLAGGENIFADAAMNWPTVSLEEVVRRDPDVVVLPVGEMPAQTLDAAPLRARLAGAARGAARVRGAGGGRRGEPARTQHGARGGAAPRRDPSRGVRAVTSREQALLPKLALLALVLALACLLAVRVGAVQLSAGEILSALAGEGDPRTVAIVRGLRVPRVVLAALCGGALALSGMTFQALLRNPLADPFILGVSSGAATGAVAAVVLHLDRMGVWVIPCAAFLGALLAVLLVFRVAIVPGRALDARTLLLAGVIVGAFGNAAILLFLTFADAESFRSAVFWMMGSLASASWQYALLLGLPLAAALPLLFGFARALNLLAVGEPTAAALGVRVERVKYAGFVLAALLAAVAVAVSGVIGFVGLVVPHAVRLALGQRPPVAHPLRGAARRHLPRARGHGRPDRGCPRRAAHRRRHRAGGCPVLHRPPEAAGCLSRCGPCAASGSATRAPAKTRWPTSTAASPPAS